MVSKILKSITLSFLLISSLNAKLFTSQFCEFQLPPGWECALEGTEWVCQSTNDDRKKEAIIILAAKERGDQDTLQAYQAYLKQKKMFQLPGGKNIVSEPSYTKTAAINGHSWIDALHLQSEIPGFYTRYLATVKEKLGVAVTFSVAKDHYASYQAVFDKVVQTLRVFAPDKYSSKGTFKLAKGSGTDVTDNIDFVGDDAGAPQLNFKQKQKQTGGGDPTTDYIIYAVLAGGVIFALTKMKGGKKGSSGGKKKKKKKKK